MSSRPSYRGGGGGDDRSADDASNYRTPGRTVSGRSGDRPNYGARGGYSGGGGGYASGAASTIPDDTTVDLQSVMDQSEVVSVHPTASASVAPSVITEQPTRPKRSIRGPALMRGHIEHSAGTSRLNRILKQTAVTTSRTITKTKFEKVQDPNDLSKVADFCSRIVLPPLKVDPHSIGGKEIEHSYPESLVPEALLVFRMQSYESTGAAVDPTALQYPAEYAQHKRSLVGLVGKGGRKKLRYIVLARSTNQPIARPKKQTTKKVKEREEDEASEHDYDTMFAADNDDSDFHVMDDDKPKTPRPAPPPPPPPEPKKEEEAAEDMPDVEAMADDTPAVSTIRREEDEISSFPVLVCLTLNSDGTAPDIRKIVGLINLTTVQDLHATVVQLAFSNGETLRINFGGGEEDGSTDAANPGAKGGGSSMEKERFIWSLLLIHSMLCSSVVERNSYQDAFWLPPLNVRNLDRAELQYVATTNGFLKESRVLRGLLDRQRPYLEYPEDEKKKSADGDERKDMEDMDALAYDLMMGNFHTRVQLFQSEDERKDSEEILNSTQWTASLNKDESAAVSVAERLSTMLQGRMRDLEAETCRRLIAWEDEKHQSVKSDAFTIADERDTVDALALASLFKTLEALDSELAEMEDWLQDRAAAIKPLTDDCADIEEENRQLEQQWKSYDMLGSEMRRLLQGSNIEPETEKILKNPASALVYDEEGRVNVQKSTPGVGKIYEAGKTLQEKLSYPMKSGGLHLAGVSERAKGLDGLTNRFCTALAHIIVTVMEQFNEEVLAGSDYGKVSKNDTHGMIAKKIRDTQRKFQSSLLGYIKLIEILAALSPEMLPALRDAYSEMVAESILMKKRMKGYFQALPGRNAAYMNKAGKDLREYVPFAEEQVLELVNAPDIRNALTELLPVIAREAYFTSALFGATSKEQDGREKKRNFENTRAAVDNASQHFRYYIERTCGILPDSIGGKTTIENGVKGDPLLCLVGSVYLNEAMDNYIDREKKGGDHSLSLAYVRATILDLRKKADKQWVGWVDKQIEWIRTHEGVPISGKRAGVFPSFARFPCYLDHVIHACSEGREEDNYVPDLVNIKVINYYMQKLASTLLESLKECTTRETTDQSYAANVMQMENTYFFTQAIKHRGPMLSELFAKQVTKANAICKESTDSYLGWMIKREFVSLHELFSRVSKLRKDVGDKQVPTHVPKFQFVRSLQKEASKDVMKEKIGIMFTRMEKHLSEEGGLLPVAWKALVKVLYEWFGRWEKMSTQIYGHKVNPSAVDIVRIAKAAGGAQAKKGPATVGANEFGFKSILALGNKQTI